MARFIQIGLLTLLAVTLAFSQEPGGSVSGTVVDADTQVSVGGAVVVMPGVGQVTTDEAGRFRISGVGPGRHTIQAVRSGMAMPLRDRSVSTVTLRPGEDVRNVRLSLAPFGVIRGRITGDDGNPLSGALVEALIAGYERGKRAFTAPSLPAGILNYSRKTDTNGEYRFELPQGVYYIKAQGNRPASTASNVASVFAGSPSAYYPGTPDPEAAAKVVLAGGEAPGIDFRVPSAMKSLHRISVRVAGDGQPVRIFATAGMQFAELRDRFSTARMPILAPLRNETRDSQTVLIEGVPSGSYDLFMDGVMADGRRSRGVTTIDVRDEDVSDIVLTMHPAQNIPGRVVASDPVKAVAPSTLTVTLGTRRISVGSDGGFVVPEVLDGFYSVAVEGLPPEAFIADIRYGGTSLYETARSLNGPELHAGLLSTPLEIVVSAKGGTVEGTVENREGAAGATVVLVPGAGRRFVQSYYKVSVTGAEGSFLLTGVPPGTYEVFAWDSVPETAWLNPEFMSRWEGRGQSVAVDAGRTVHVNARLLRED